MNLRIEDIKPAPNNAKEHTDKQLKKIAASIAELGFDQPVVVDKNGVIIIGHARYIAATTLLGWTEIRLGVPMAAKGERFIPVILRDDLTDEEAETRRLNDNQLNAMTGINMDIAIPILKELSLAHFDLTGFDKNILLETKEDKPDLSMKGSPRSKLGDLYELGPHKLLCGDATKTEDYVRLLGTDRARMVFTDPPYSIDYSSGISYDSDKFGGTGGRIFNDDKTPEEALVFYRAALAQIHTFSTEDATLYWWYANRLTEINMQALRHTKWHYSQIVIWLKNSLIYSPRQLYHRIYEPCMVAWKEGGKHYQNLTFSTYTELWNLDKKSFADYLDAWYQKRDNTSKYIHPTQKPVQLAERALKRSCEENDIVLDAFGGSGSTLIACEQLGRRARLLELDPKYVDAIVGRWCKYIDDPKVVKNGEEIQWAV
jgi:DNA modification methylase